MSVSASGSAWCRGRVGVGWVSESASASAWVSGWVSGVGVGVGVGATFATVTAAVVENAPAGVLAITVKAWLPLAMPVVSSMPSSPSNLYGS